jgi:hypothetical protein
LTRDESLDVKAANTARDHQRSESMGQESMWKLLLRFSGPSIVTQVAFLPQVVWPL